MASLDAVALQLVARFDGWQNCVIFTTAIDAQETVEEDDLTLGFKDELVVDLA